MSRVKNIPRVEDMGGRKPEVQSDHCGGRRVVAPRLDPYLTAPAIFLLAMCVSMIVPAA